MSHEADTTLRILIYSNSLKLTEVEVPYPAHLPKLVEGDEITVIFRQTGAILAVSSAHLEVVNRKK